MIWTTECQLDRLDQAWLSVAVKFSLIFYFILDLSDGIWYNIGSESGV